MWGRAEVARQPHKLKVGGSNPSPATIEKRLIVDKRASVTLRVGKYVDSTRPKSSERHQYKKMSCNVPYNKCSENSRDKKERNLRYI